MPPEKSPSQQPVTADLPSGAPLAPAAGLDIKALAQLGADASSIHVVGLPIPTDAIGLPAQIPVALINGKTPEARSLRRLLEEYRLFPDRKRGQAVAQTLASFVELANRHKTADSAIFADMDWQKPALTAVIDYHQATSGGRANNGKHRIHYAFPLSDEWKKWTEMNGTPMSQKDFAWFLEDRVAELASPDAHEQVTLEAQFATAIATPAQLVELSRGLAVHVDQRVKASVTLSSGEGQIAFEETHNDAATGKPLKVPGLFILNIAPFFMGDTTRIPVRLRYRPLDGKIMWFFQIYRPDQYITQHVRDVLAEARDRTKLPVFEGTPEMSL